MKATKTMEKKCKAIVKKTNKMAKKNPVAAVGIGGGILAIATSAVTSTMIHYSKKMMGKILDKKINNAVEETENTTTLTVVPTTEAPATTNDTAEAPKTEEEQKQ